MSLEEKLEKKMSRMWEINFQLFLMYRTLLAFKEHALFFFCLFFLCSTLAWRHSHSACYQWSSAPSMALRYFKKQINVVSTSLRKRATLTRSGKSEGEQEFPSQKLFSELHKLRLHSWTSVSTDSCQYSKTTFSTKSNN